MPPQAAAFARDVVTRAAPGGRERAKNLLWAAGRLADWGTGLGLEPAPEVLLHPSVTGRFAAHAPGLTGVTRRTLRTNLRFLARRVVPGLAPAEVPLPRERAKAPYGPAQIDGYLALADAQPTVARRMRAAGLVCLGAGAGLIRADLRAVRGSDISRRSGGVIVAVSGKRPRAVPVLARYHQPLLASATFAGTGLVTGGTDPGRRNVTTPLTRALAGGTGLPRLDTSRLRATWLLTAPPRSGWLRSCTPPGSPAASASVTCSPALTPAARPRRSRCWAGSGDHPAAPARGHHRGLRDRAADRGTAPPRGPPPPAQGQHLNPGHDAHPGRPPSRAPHRGACALTALPPADQVRLGVTEDWKAGPHQLTYRQAERTFGLITQALAKDKPDGTPSAALTAVLDDLLEASIPPDHKNASTSLAVDWTDVESFSRPPRPAAATALTPRRPGDTATPTCPAPKASCSSGTTSRPPPWPARKPALEVPGLTRRMTLSSCHADPVRAFTPVLARMPANGIALGDVLADSGYAHRDAGPGPSRSAPPAPSSSATCTRTTAALTAPTPGRSSPTATSTAPPPPHRCCTWDH